MTSTSLPQSTLHLQRYSSEISIVITYLDYCLKYLPACLDSIESQTLQGLEVIIVDQTRDKLVESIVNEHGWHSSMNVLCPDTMEGFAANYNAGIRAARGDFVFVLNPDTILEKDCVAQLVQACRQQEEIGAVSPKILRMGEDQKLPSVHVLDSTGLCISRFIRHYDRGAGQIDQGQYDAPCFLFGVTGAGAFFRKSCLEAIKIGNQYFDEDFWSYREDADICWRMQNYGWTCLYAPNARMYHVRTLKPGGRSRNSRPANMHSVKNRYQLMLNNLSLRTYIRNFPFIFSRDIVVILGVLLTEIYSVRAFGYLLINFPRLLAKRAVIQRRIVRDRSEYWFGRTEAPFGDGIAASQQ